MRTDNEVTQSPAGAQRQLQVCLIVAFLAALLWLAWAFVPVFTSGGSLDVATVSRRVLIPIGFIVLHVAGVVLASSIVAAMFAQANWRGRRMAVGQLVAGVLLFGAEAMLMWEILVVSGIAGRVDLVLWILAGIAVSFLSTWLLLEPLLRLPREVSDVARIDGLGFAGLYWHVLLPRIKTRILVASLLPFIAGLSYVVASLAPKP